MCNPSEQNRLNENEKIKQIVARQHEWWNNESNLQPAKPPKDAHPTTHEPLDLE